MAKEVSQGMFDDIVNENMQEFEMTAEDAISDAIQQLECQGVNILGIIKEPSLYGDGKTGDISAHPIVGVLRRLSQFADDQSTNTDHIVIDLKQLRDECDVDLSHRCLAGRYQAYDILITLLGRYFSNTDVVIAILNALCAVSNGQPDLLTDGGSDLFLQCLCNFKDRPDVLVPSVKLVRLLCVKHEANRQSLVSKGLISSLAPLLQPGQFSEEIVKEVCIALRVLTFDDDIRVPFGKAHDHAKSIVLDVGCLKSILDNCEVCKDNIAVVGELFLTLGSLAVRNDFCEEIMNLGGIKLIVDTFERNMADKVIVRQALAVLRSLVKSDEVKDAVVKRGGIELVVAGALRHLGNVAVAEAACGVLAGLTLRRPVYCVRVVECGGHEVVVNALRIHRADVSVLWVVFGTNLSYVTLVGDLLTEGGLHGVDTLQLLITVGLSPCVCVQKAACMALRNLVARSRELCDAVLELGAERLLNKISCAHCQCACEATAALRDLGCVVHLQELWTGKKGSLMQ